MEDMRMPEARQSNTPALTPGQNGQFDVLDWHPAYQSCQKYFLDHAQYDKSVQAVAALINICLPFQWHQNPIRSFTQVKPQSAVPNQIPSEETPNQPTPLHPNSFFATSRPRHLPSPPPYLTMSTSDTNWASLVPFIRRLIVTGFDREPVLYGFFGNDWRKGIGPLQECERRNYLFAAKSGGWAKVKSQYDMGPQETVPFLQPPINVQVAEIENAEKLWSQWLATEDWMIGPRAPNSTDDYHRSSQD